MGIYDRDYYRRDRSGVFAIFEGTGQVCTTIIVVTVAAFILQVVTGVPPLALNSGPITDTFDFDYRAISQHGQVWRLLTYAFLHSTGNIWHIVFNMLLFWMVGREIEAIEFGSERQPGEVLLRVLRTFPGSSAIRSAVWRPAQLPDGCG